MQDYIINALNRAETAISEEVKRAKTLPAFVIDHIYYRDVITRVTATLGTSKSFPAKYKEQVRAILSYTWQEQIAHGIVYPVLYNGYIYSKWDAMPEECRAFCLSRDGIDNRVSVFMQEFKEGKRWNHSNAGLDERYSVRLVHGGRPFKTAQFFFAGAYISSHETEGLAWKAAREYSNQRG